MYILHGTHVYNPYIIMFGKLRCSDSNITVLIGSWTVELCIMANDGPQYTPVHVAVWPIT